MILQHFINQEPMLDEMYRADRSEAPAYDMDNARISRYDQALRETFTVPETGAVLTYEGAVPLVEQTCSLLPHAMGVAPPRPAYEETTTMSDGNPCYFISNLRLPTAVPLPRNALLFMGTPRTSKSEAKRAVAFEAAKTLYRYKLLNEYLLPHREKKGDRAEDGAGRQLGEDLDLELEVPVRSTWGDIWKDSAELFVHRWPACGRNRLWSSDFGQRLAIPSLARSRRSGASDRS
jgi:endoribonuclease Dicer